MLEDGGMEREREEGMGVYLCLLVRICAFGRRDQLCRQLGNVLEIARCVKVEVDRIRHNKREARRPRALTGGRSV